MPPDVTPFDDTTMKAPPPAAPAPPSPIGRRWRDELNFLVTNRVPRALLTHLMGWYSRLRSRWLTRLSIAIWRRFTPLDLEEAQQQRFDSVHDCFVRALKPGRRPLDPDPAVLASPCDAIVGACGAVAGTEVFQAKGFPYRLEELFGGDTALAESLRDGHYVTLRLTAGMYHRFHAPDDLHVHRVSYISGDTWNVNPVALARVQRLFCRNERALVHATLADGSPLLLVPVAAILVASIRLHCLPERLHLHYRGPNRLDCDARYARGQEMGWFEHGSTILVFVPPGCALCEGIAPGHRLRMGERLLRRVRPAPARAEGGAGAGLHTPVMPGAEHDGCLR